jgi:hypothetical protein
MRTFFVETCFTRRKGSPIRCHSGLEEAFGMIDGQLPQCRHRLPRFKREFQEL